MACYCAISKLEEVSKQLEKGSITILDLRKIKDKQQQMKRLCESASAQQKETNMPVEVTYERMIFTVGQRMQEFEIFKKQQGVRLHLCHNIRHEIKGKTITCYGGCKYSTFFQVSEKQRLSSKRIMIHTRSTHCALDLETPLR